MSSTDAIDPAVAVARLTVSYGMTEHGAWCLLDLAREAPKAETATVRVTLVSSYPERFTVEPL